MTDNVFTADYCDRAFQKAADEFTAQKPVYESRQDCEQDWGDTRCDPEVRTGTAYVHGGGGGYYYGQTTNRTLYSPRMTGVWMGYREKAPTDGTEKPVREFYQKPLMTTRSGTIVAPSTAQAFESFGRTSTAPGESVVIIGSSASRPALPAGSSYFSSSGGSISRGGFGEAGHGFGSGE